MNACKTVYDEAQVLKPYKQAFLTPLPLIFSEICGGLKGRLLDIQATTSTRHCDRLLVRVGGMTEYGLNTRKQIG
jgi:hypothetical protein